ncbi:MAG: pyridoxal phosphate-dependent aminotransferase family protein, partial [Muribaculaceae bacterium]
MKLLQAKLDKYQEPQKAKAAGIYPYFRKIESEQDTVVLIDGKKVLMFGSNSYLGLTNHPKIKEAAIAATRKYGTGCAGSPFLNGTLDIHKDLEVKLAKFVGKEDAMIYSTGFEVNLGVVSCLTGREDYIICDEQDHASIIEGRRLSFSQALKYKHNDMASLEKVLANCKPDKIKLIVTDGVFSMEGDVAKLPEIVALAKKYNATVMVDEAHGIGVFGNQGRGTCDHFGVSNDVDLIMGTFSKSFASLGGFIACDTSITNYLRHHSRSYIFTASITPASTAAASAALDIMLAEPERKENLWKV